MDQKSKLLRGIPAVDALLCLPALAEKTGPGLTRAARDVLARLRMDILSGERTSLPDPSQLCASILDQLERGERPSLRRVINGTGVVLHTNLGRACLSSRAAAAAAQAAAGFSTLEYDPQTGGRGSRHTHVEALLCQLTGAEAALAVNNNAAALLLILTALTRNREVLVSRGELVEIGGSFRIPDVLLQSGALLREVGTTNKTRLSDYQQAISPDTAAILKVHPGNYRMLGFTESTPLSALAALGQRHQLPVIEDQGGGALLSPARYGAPDEPCVPESVAAGADLVCFSGDKLLGGPQAGLVVGRKRYIDLLKAHPLARAVRAGKLTLAALEATLRAYHDPARAWRELPVLSMLSAAPDQLRARANALCALLQGRPNVTAEVVPVCSQVGGGGIPCLELPSWAVAASLPGLSAGALERRLREHEPPVIGRIVKERLLLDLRTLFDEDFAVVAAALSASAKLGEANE